MRRWGDETETPAVFDEIRGRGGNFRFKGYIRLSGQLQFCYFCCVARNLMI